MIVVLVVLAFLVLNGIFVAAEFAIVAAPRPAMERLAAKGHRRAARISKIMREPVLQDRYIATAQLGIAAASLGLGMYGELKLAAIFSSWLGRVDVPSWIAVHALASIIAVILLTYFHIVIGEMVPKAVALARTERTVFWLEPIMHVAQIVTWPLIAVLNRACNGLLRVVGIARRPGRDHFMSSQELRYVVRESEERGLIESESAKMIDQLFDFGRRTAREAMVPRVKISGIELSSPVRELTRMVLDSPHTRYPVYERNLDHVIGTVHTRELLRRLSEQRPLDRSDLWPVPFVPETATLNDVLKIMRDRRSHIVIVMDEHGGTAGLLTIDALFAEVVGVIPESVEEDVDRDITIDPRGFLEVDGTVRVESLAREIGVSLEEEVDTVSGLVLARLRRPPRVGDVVQVDSVRIEVLEVEGHGVTRCRVTPPVTPQPER